MWSSNSFLKACERLKNAGFPFVPEQGLRIGRGYADLGYEEFLLLQDRTMLSLFSGKTSELPEGHENFFFVIPSPDEIVHNLATRGASIESISFHQQRIWKVIVGGSREISVEGRTLHEALLSALTTLLENKNVPV